MLSHTYKLKLPFFLIDNFLSQSYLSYVLEEIKKLKNYYSRDGYNNKKTIRDRLDPRYCGTQYISNPRNILYSIWDKYFWDYMEEHLLNSRDSGFIHSLYTRSGQVLLSCYNNNDYYGPHVDVDMGNIITAVLMLSFNNKFTGGDLILDEDCLIKFKNNKLIVFPSCMPHEVTKIELDSSEYLDCRFSLQYFVSASPYKKPLLDEGCNIE